MTIGAHPIDKYVFGKGMFVISCTYHKHSIREGTDPGQFGYFIQVTLTDKHPAFDRFGAACVASFWVGTPQYSNFFSCCGVGQLRSFGGYWNCNELSIPKEEMKEIGDSLLFYLYQWQQVMTNRFVNNFMFLATNGNRDQYPWLAHICSYSEKMGSEFKNQFHSDGNTMLQVFKIDLNTLVGKLYSKGQAIVYAHIKIESLRIGGMPVLPDAPIVVQPVVEKETVKNEPQPTIIPATKDAHERFYDSFGYITTRPVVQKAESNHSARPHASWTDIEPIQPVPKSRVRKVRAVAVPK